MDVPYEHIVIDNCSTDASYDILKELARLDSNLKLIRNMSNYGHIRSPVHGMFQGTGQAIVAIASDLQTPPEVIPDLLERWREGSPVVLLQRTTTGEGRAMTAVRTAYYGLLEKLSQTPVVPNATGEGLYDRRAIDILRQVSDPNPFVRGLVAQLGFPIATVPFEQQRRVAGKSKNNWISLFDIGLLGISSLSRTPLRLISLVGFVSALISLLIALIFLARKLLDWDAFELGLAPIAVGLFFFGSIQLTAIGLLGEYVGNIFAFVRRHPLVVEYERVNFTDSVAK